MTDIILTQTVPNGYTKSIETLNGTITAYVKSGGIYIERRLDTLENIETENMGIALIMNRIPIREDNLDAILIHLYEQQSVMV